MIAAHHISRAIDNVQRGMDDLKMFAATQFVHDSTGMELELELKEKTSKLRTQAVQVQNLERQVKEYTVKHAELAIANDRLEATVGDSTRELAAAKRALERSAEQDAESATQHVKRLTGDRLHFEKQAKERSADTQRLSAALKKAAVEAEGMRSMLDTMTTEVKENRESIAALRSTVDHKTRAFNSVMEYLQKQRDMIKEARRDSLLPEWVYAVRVVHSDVTWADVDATLDDACTEHARVLKRVLIACRGDISVDDKVHVRRVIFACMIWECLHDTTVVEKSTLNMMTLLDHGVKLTDALCAVVA